MPSISYTIVHNQGQQMPPPTPCEQEQEEQNCYRLVVRFGKDLLQDGFTAFPNLLLDLYAELGISHCELVFIMHLMQYKWSKHDPYPSLGTIATKMGLSLRAVQNHVHSLRHKAFRCPHTHQNAEEEGGDTPGCSCPRYLVVTHRYRAGMGQTSSSYNLSGLFAAIITLAREKGLLPAAEDHAKNCTPPREERCTGGMKKPAYESDESKNTQLESNESFSNSLKDESVAQAYSQVERGTIRNTQGSTTQPADRSTTVPPSSHHRNNTSPSSHRSPSPPHVREPSNLESSPSRETSRQRQSFFRKDEVKRERERPRMKPLTQDEIDAKRKMGQNASGQTPLQAILNEISPPEHQETLNRQFGERGRPAASTPSGLQCTPMPVYQELQRAVERISQELGDFHHAKSNITRTDNIRREADVSLEQLLDALREAHHATRVAQQKGSITKRDEQGRLVKTSYFFAVLRQKLGLPPKPACTQ